MKFAFLILAVLSSGPAFASPALWCGNETSKLSVTFATPARYAAVQIAARHETVRTLANLTCRDVNPAERADAGYLLCEAANSAYTVALGNSAGLAVSVYEGGALVATLPCTR